MPSRQHKIDMAKIMNKVVKLEKSPSISSILKRTQSADSLPPMLSRKVKAQSYYYYHHASLAACC